MNITSFFNVHGLAATALTVSLASLSAPTGAANGANPPYPGQPYQTPASLACLYGLVPKEDRVPGCSPDETAVNVEGGSGTIVIVVGACADTLQADLDKFSAQFGLPGTTLEILSVNAATPRQWPQSKILEWHKEAALDTQAVHAFAPNARIVVVKAATGYDDDLQEAIRYGLDILDESGGGQMSLSLGSLQDRHPEYYTTDRPGITIIAASGDNSRATRHTDHTGILAVGGTNLEQETRDTPDGPIVVTTGETAWRHTGGGLSFVPNSRPDYQDGLAGLLGDRHGIPDVAFMAWPGMWCVLKDAWEICAGTSLSAPAIAGIVNTANSGPYAADTNVSSRTLHEQIYRHPERFRDVVGGVCGQEDENVRPPFDRPPYFYPNGAAKGYDTCTGWGTPVGLKSFRLAARHVRDEPPAETCAVQPVQNAQTGLLFCPKSP